MILTLEVNGPQASALGAARRKVFGVEGGTIGRLPDNDWVLADPYVSGRHAIIRFFDGAFHIEDTSRNGVFVNTPEDRVIRGRPHVIESGDRILIDPYEIEAMITDHSNEPAVHSGGGRQDAPYIPEDSVFGPRDGSPLSHDPLQVVPHDPLQGLGLEPHSPPASRASAPPIPDVSGGSPWGDHYRPPAVVPGPPAAPEQIPANWMDSGFNIPPAPPQQPPAPPARPASPPGSLSQGRPPASAAAPAAVPAAPSQMSGQPDSGGLGALLRAAGVSDGSVTPELARDFGQIMRVVVTGVMDVLKARQATKDEFGLGMTTFKRTDNNPLKFSADVEDALHNLFVRRQNTAYLGPVNAFEDAFDDMRNHQLAMLAGVRVAFEAMLSEFHPDHLQEQFDRQQKKGALASIGGKRYWDQYREWIHDMVADADRSFRELFGDEFARAYEEQLKKLKAQGRSAKG
jgi:type VI secretion system FHA domain protein